VDPDPDPNLIIQIKIQKFKYKVKHLDNFLKERAMNFCKKMFNFFIFVKMFEKSTYNFFLLHHPSK